MWGTASEALVLFSDSICTFFKHLFATTPRNNVTFQFCPISDQFSRFLKGLRGSVVLLPLLTAIEKKGTQLPELTRESKELSAYQLQKSLISFFLSLGRRLSWHLLVICFLDECSFSCFLPSFLGTPFLPMLITFH